MFTNSAIEMISLRGKTALITGAAAGIGHAIACRYAEAGADLDLVDIDAPGLELLTKELSALDIKITAHVYDMSSAEAISNLWSDLAAAPDILVNNVGIYPPARFSTMKDDLWNKVMDTNVNSTYRMCQRMLKQRAREGGIIINMASIEAILPFADNLTHYDVSKAGVIALTRAIAKEYGSKGFRVNAILPGGIVTPGTQAIAERVWRQFDIGLIPSGIKYQSRLPLHRRGQPDEVACVALFLASGLASYVQGALIPVDGGFLSS